MDTLLQHFGEDPEEFLGSVTPPVFRNSLFVFPDCATFEEAFRGKAKRDLYTRQSNPTTRVLERKIARLEDADDAIACASGMGAISAVFFALLASGDHLICFSRAYAPTIELARRVLGPFGVALTFLEPDEIGQVDRHVRDATKLIYVESPASFTFEVIDLEPVAELGRRLGIPTAIDNSWATPLYQQPLRMGIDLSVHSGTKYIGGHSDILLGLVAGRSPLIERVRRVATLLGATLSPADAQLAIRGLRTLSLRLARHEASALLLARRLLDHERVLEVLHPALPWSRGHRLWQKQFCGSSGLFSFRLRGDVRRFCDALRLFRLGVSWGGFESLVFPHAVVASALGDTNARPDISLDVIRLSVGLEDPEDLWTDLERGFAAL